MKRVLLTGATGFVGQHLLSTPAKWQIKVSLRRPEGNLAGRCETVVVGDIDHQTDWAAAVTDVECVVHMAGRVHVMDRTADEHQLCHKVNVLGTERLARAAVEHGVKRFIFLSSVKVNGEATYGKPYMASDPGAPVDEYGISKWQAEQSLFRIARESGLEVMVIRPPLVYGPGVRANFRRLLSWVCRGLPLPLGAVRNSRSLVSVWNLCDLVKCAVEAPAVSSGVLMVSDGRDLSTPELIRRLAMAMGRSPRLISMPEGLLELAGALTGKRAEVSRLCGSLTVDISDTKRQLGWIPPVSTDEGLAQTARWYLNEVRARGS